jgi:hypothetical protein
MHLSRRRQITYQQLPIGTMTTLFAMHAFFVVTASQKSLSETAPVASFHFLKQEQKSREVLSNYTCILSPPETSD